MPFLLAHAPYIHTCPTKTSHADPKIDFRWPTGPVGSYGCSDVLVVEIVQLLRGILPISCGRGPVAR
eukprot:COSAG01_NODE_1522_length_10022_cov_81.163761_7_plen_67_part_00